MLRYFLLVATLALLTEQLAAREPLVRMEDYGDITPSSVWIADVEIPDPAEVVSPGFKLGADLEDVSDDGQSQSDGPADSDNARGFHSVCYCRCGIQPLDRWCDYCGPTCTTDCWCQHPCQCSHGNCYLTDTGRWVSNDAWCDVRGNRPYQADSAVRFGWWGVSTDGSPNKVGEYQDLSSSPFWDVDAISSNGVRTVDMSLTGLDNEATNARLNYFGPSLSANVNYQRYLRLWDHDPLTGYDLANPVPPGADDNVVSEDLNVGEDYAIRIQELDARFKGNLTNNIKWRLNLWGMRKFGERQANAVAHCFEVGGAAGNTCHVLSQKQDIDWLTMEIQPVVEAKFEYATVEYSRTMRSFGQNDQLVTRQYTHFGFSPANNVLGPDFAYALVPDNFTQIDRLKVQARLTDNNRFYANLYTGNTKNEFRDTHRNYDGFDLRLMNDTYADLDVTAYVSHYDETNELPTVFLTSPPYAPANTFDEDSLRHPVDYTRTRAGLKGTWDPFGNQRTGYGAYGFRDGSTIAWGYEYYRLDRDFATYDTTPVPPGPFTQPDTNTHQILLGPSTRWSRQLNTYTRYKVQFIHVPLIGVSEYSDDDPGVNGVFNSNLPEQQHIVEIGGTWTPTYNFMATAQLSTVNSWQRSQFANFVENNYPITCSAWYAPTHRLSFTGAYAHFTNWINQDITLGANRGDPTETETTRWNYGGVNNLVSVNANFAWRENVQFIGGYEWNRGSNVFTVPPSPAGADWSLLPSLSDVVVETQRLTAGVDWQPARRANVYARYIYFDYDDISSGLYSGTAHMALAGGALVW